MLNILFTTTNIRNLDENMSSLILKFINYNYITISSVNKDYNSIFSIEAKKEYKNKQNIMLNHRFLLTEFHYNIFYSERMHFPVFRKFDTPVIYILSDSDSEQDFEKSFTWPY